MANGLQNIETTVIEILSDLGRYTATSFWEDGPAGYLAERAKTAGLDVLIDEWGNVLATKVGSDSSAPGIAFVAHMDHPGFEVVEIHGKDTIAIVRGGVPEA